MTFLVLLVIILLCRTIAITIPSNPADSLSTCLTEFYQHSKENGALIAFSSQEDAHLIPSGINGQLAWMNLLANDERTQRVALLEWRHRLVVILARTPDDVGRSLALLSTGVFWDARGKYVVALTDENVSDKDVAAVLNIAWHHYIVNVAILRRVTDVTEVWTHYPYRNTCGNGTDIVKEGLCQYLEAGQHFPMKVPADMHGCPLRVAVNLYSPFLMIPTLFNDRALHAGFETVIFNNVVRRSNMSLVVVKTDYANFGSKFADGTFDGPYEPLASGNCDVSYGHLWPNVSYDLDFDMTTPYFHDAFVWHVPAAKPGKQWKSLGLIFDVAMWASVGAALVWEVGTWWLISRAAGEPEPLISFALRSWCSLLLGGVRAPNKLAPRFVLVTWTLFALLTGTAYQSQLLGLLMRPIYEPQIRNIEEMVSVPLRIVLVQDNVGDFKYSNIGSEREITRRGTVISYTEYANMRVNYNADRAFFGSLMRTRYLTRKYYTYPNGNPKVYPFRDVSKILPVSLFFRRGHPMFNRFEKMLKILQEAGLVSKWVADTEQHESSTGDAEPQQLVFNHLAGAFFLLALGLQMATVMFFTELAMRKAKPDMVLPYVATD